MRKLALALLLASSAAPSFAAIQQRGDDDEPEARSERSDRPSRAERRQAREERQQAREERRQVRAARPERSFDAGGDSGRRSVAAPSRDLPAAEDRAEPAIERSERPVIERIRERSSRVRRSADLERRGAPTPATDEPAVTADSPADIERRHVRRAPLIDRSGEDLVEPVRRLPDVLERGRRTVSRTPMPGTEPPAPETATADVAEPRHRWRGDWRRDRRFDWRDHRRRHRSLFHLGFYFDPFGWRYHRYGIGWRLWPSYYSSRFWLRDPWMYRLPPAYGPYRWIRYHDDALLVNIYSGRVVDVIYNFFW